MYCLQIKRIWLVLKPLPGERTVETWHRGVGIWLVGMVGWVGVGFGDLRGLNGSVILQNLGELSLAVCRHYRLQVCEEGKDG